MFELYYTCHYNKA